MKDKKRIEIMLKLTERVDSKNSGMQSLIDESMTDICKKEDVSPKQVYFGFSLLLSLSLWAI